MLICAAVDNMLQQLVKRDSYNNNTNNNIKQKYVIRSAHIIVLPLLAVCSMRLVIGAIMTLTLTARIANASIIEHPIDAAILAVTDAILSPDAQDNCPTGYFHCNGTAQCVQQRMNCDGTVDCDDNSDEWNCVNDVDAIYWDHFFRKQPFGQHDDIKIGNCSWPTDNLSCDCRGNEILCRFHKLTVMPVNLPTNNLQMLDLTGNNFIEINEAFFDSLPDVHTLVLKLCGIERIAANTFNRLATIPLEILYLDENNLTSLPQNLFPVGNKLQVLIISGNCIVKLDSLNFVNLLQLKELDLRANLIEEFDASVFEPLINLNVLYLNKNRLKYIDCTMFSTLNKLVTLSLAENHIQHIESGSFRFPHLRHLFLAGNRLTTIAEDTFCNLHWLQGLNLNDNKLRNFHIKAFNCLDNLTSLWLENNDFKKIDSKVFKNLTNLNYIYFSWFHLCRAALHVRVCAPRGDGISSTYHLLDNPILRSSVWIMAFIAIIGNLLVLLGRYFYKSRSNVEHSMYLRHLAASDFLMGVYLAIIATADINFRGEYILYEEQWRHSRMCAFAGFLSTFSCQSSTLLLTLVTWDRLMSVTRPLQTRETNKIRIVVRLFVLWSASFALAFAPLFPNDYFGRYFYGNNGVCLSLHIHDPYAKGWEYSAILFICINTFSLIFILISYVRMLQAIRNSGGGMRSTLSGRESVVATRFAIIVITDCACWFPIIVVKLAALAGCPISPALYAWLAVLVLPVNSALNPILYTLTTAAFKQQLLRYIHSVPPCTLLSSEPRSQTQTAIESGLSTSLCQFNNSGRKRFSHKRMSYL